MKNTESLIRVGELETLYGEKKENILLEEGSNFR